MILEHAVLQVIPGLEVEFEAAFEQARPLIEGSIGFRSLRLLPCVEDEGRFLLLVEWESLDDHVHGFREGPSYERWRELLHHFYDPFPLVDHYRND